MQKLILSLVLVALFTLPFLRAQSHYQPKPLVFTHVTVIDATGAPAKPDMTVVITDNRITELGPTKRVRVPKDVQAIDAIS